MKLSHSKLNKIFECPMSYYLNYVQGISLKTEKSALAIGSAVHWGIEHNTEDLTDYYYNEGSFKQKNNYTVDQLLAESMVHGYLLHKNEIFADILKDTETGEQLEIIDEEHELELYGKLKSNKYKEHNFMGIIDCLLLTEKGWIVIDYKTSSMTPDWSKYLEQLYRYIFLLQENFPEVPVYKLVIINIKKTAIKQKKNECEESYFKRLKDEYDLNEDLISSHIYDPKEFDEKLIKLYINNLTLMADNAQLIVDNQMWFINFNNAISVYGKSEYYDIFYHTPNAYLLYKIKDITWDDDDGWKTTRDCRAIDMLTIEHPNVLNHYNDFVEKGPDLSLFDKQEVFDFFRKNYIVDEELLEIYWKTYQKQIEYNDLLNKKIAV